MIFTPIAGYANLFAAVLNGAGFSYLPASGSPTLSFQSVVPQPNDWRNGCSADTRPRHAHRRLCGRRATKRGTAERLARRSSRCDHFKQRGLRALEFSGPASGLASDRGDDLAEAPSTEAQRHRKPRPVRQAASFTRSVKEKSPRSPVTGRAAPNPVGTANPFVFGIQRCRRSLVLPANEPIRPTAAR